MKNCETCMSNRVLTMCAKCSDLCWASYKELEHDGYVPRIAPFGDEGYGDYLEISVCCDCGRVQGFKPLTDAAVRKAFKEA